MPWAGMRVATATTAAAPAASGSAPAGGGGALARPSSPQSRGAPPLSKDLPPLGKAPEQGRAHRGGGSPAGAAVSGDPTAGDHPSLAPHQPGDEPAAATPCALRGVPVAAPRLVRPSGEAWLCSACLGVLDGECRSSALSAGLGWSGALGGEVLGQQLLQLGALHAVVAQQSVARTLAGVVPRLYRCAVCECTACCVSLLTALPIAARMDCWCWSIIIIIISSSSSISRKSKQNMHASTCPLVFIMP